MTPGAVLLGLSLLLPQQDSLLARAESLLAAGELRGARAIAERLVRGNPRDHRALVLLGRVHLRWPTVGRFRAETLFTRAAALAPRDPEPLYYLGHVGLALGGDDGETIARPALVRMLALEPEYRDGWQLWLRLYRGPRERRDAVTALERHAGSHMADVRRAQLLIELGRLDHAAALLDSAIARRPLEPLPRALLARAFFEAGRDSAGAAAYEGALRLAHRDAAGALWEQVRSIAAPGERAYYESVEVSGREAFFRQFWARRDPDLFTSLNERMGEHFRRFGEATRGYRLLHPNAMYHRSSLWRALAGDIGGPQARELGPAVAEALTVGCGTRMSNIQSELAQIFGAPGLRRDSAPAASPNSEEGLDDRGRIWVRYGRPDYTFVFGNDGETWCYATPRGMLRVTFMRRTGGGWGGAGDMVVTPVVPGEAEDATYLLATDQPTVEPRHLSFHFWPATFRRGAGPHTDVLLMPDSLTGVAVLVDADGVTVARDSASGRPLRLVAAPGEYLLLIDGVREGRTGRYRGTTVVPRYAGLSVSGLLLAPGGTAARRDSMAAAAPPALRLSAAAPLRVYAEVYGLAGRAGVARYEAEYRFERLGGGGRDGADRDVTTVTFLRELPAAETHIESLVLDPGRLRRGRYRVQLDVRDPVSGERAASSRLEFEMR